jgi:hypothetical protein
VAKDPCFSPPGLGEDSDGYTGLVPAIIAFTVAWFIAVLRCLLAKHAGEPMSLDLVLAAMTVSSFPVLVARALFWAGHLSYEIDLSDPPRPRS